MAGTIPGPRTPAVDPDGTFNGPWLTFFQGFGGAPLPFKNITPSASPFSWTASAAGSVYVQNGTVTALSVLRGKPGALVTLPFGAVRGPVPVSNGDLVRLTYTGSPTLTFIPS